MTAVEVGFSQSHAEGQIGRMDQASLRCCDVVKGVEIGVNLHYLRLSLNFSPTPPAPPATPPQANTVRGISAAGILERWGSERGSPVERS